MAGINCITLHRQLLRIISFSTIKIIFSIQTFSEIPKFSGITFDQELPVCKVEPLRKTNKFILVLSIFCLLQNETNTNLSF